MKPHSSSSSDSRRRFVGLAGSLALLGGLGRAAAAPAPAPGTPWSRGPLAQADAHSDYQPRRGQSGKDVIWIPTPDKLVHRMLSLASVGPSDYLIDLGSGDGKIVIAAARDFGARGRGVEYNPDMVGLSRRSAEAAGVSERAAFEQADIFETDFSSATVVTMYLLPHLNMKLRHKLLALEPGTRIVSHQFRLGDWMPDETSLVGSASAHMWIVPANAGGEWALRFPLRNGEADGQLTVEQTFQTVRGRVEFDDFETTLREPRMLGERLRFAFTDQDGRLREFDGSIAGNSMSGSVYNAQDRDVASFNAERSGPAPAINGSQPASSAEINS